MLGISDLPTYLLGVIIVVLLPGPNSLYVLSVAARRGVRQGFAGACGVFSGDFVLLTLTAVGAASLLKSYPPLFAVIKYAGGGYLAWLGVAMLKGAWRRWRHGAEEAVADSNGDRPYLRALSISLMNPKAILFCVSFFVQFVDPAYAHPGVTFLALGLILQFFSALYLSLLILCGHRLASAFRRRRRLAAAMSGGVGTLFLGFGARLALASLK
ncbi:leucine efflux protein LeuE [Paludibacterium yongneupense]|uniref:leucine efflux protein LeuE n=1 Tax=Paludibacterium yongneupense TaxID=400061 RepID=UPI00040C1ED0|nr:leucine efflux protein LeuE [Paludibacterium yongneupense]